MSTKVSRAALMGAVASLSLLAGLPVHAQTATEPAKADVPASAAQQPEVETIIVRGARPIFESDRAALLVQKNADSLVTVLAADEAGRLADQNIADAVSRLPGVAVEKDQGQSRYVNLRGQPRRWVTYSIDGMSVVSPEGRETRFDNVPTAIASQISVNKAITPDQSGDTVAGNINIRTRSALDYRGRRITGGLSLGQVELGGGREIDASLVVADRFFDGKLGLLAQGSFYEREMVTDNWETDPYLRPGSTTSGIDRRPGSETRRWAREHENKPYRLTRGNISGSVRADWKPNDLDSMFIQSVYSQFTDIELRNNYIFRLDNGSTNTPATACPTTPAPITTSGVNDICTGNVPNKGTVYGVQMNWNFRTGDIKEYILTNTIGGQHKRFGWDLDWRVNFTETEDGQDLTGTPSFQSPTTVTSRPTVDYDFTDVANNTVRLYTTNLTGTVRSKGSPVTDIESFPMNFVDIVDAEGGDITSAWTGKFDASREGTLFGADTTFKLGGLYTTRDKKRRLTQYRARLADFTAAGVAPPTYGDLAIDTPFKGKYALGYTFRYYSGDKVGDLMRSLKDRKIGSYQDGSGEYFEVGEDILAGYGMATIRQDWGNVVVGGRLERTENTSKALPIIGGQRVLTQLKSEDTLFYPSVHVNYNLSEEKKLRLSVNTGAARPDFDDLAANFSIDDAPGQITGGNPDAKPEKSVGVDAYFEWYMKSQGFFSIGLYYKDISDALFTQAGTFGSNALNTPDRDRSGYNFTTIRNGGDGNILGLELAYTQTLEEFVQAAQGPDWMEGFGVRFSANFNQSEVNVPAVDGVPLRTVDLPGASDFVGNFGITYEKYGISARVAYQFRTKWLQSVGAYAVVNGVVVPNGNGDVYWNDSESLSMAVRYELNDNLELTFDGVNLADHPGRRFADTELYPIEYETFGPRYMIGVRFKY